MNTAKATGSLIAMEAALKGLTKATGTLCVEEIAEILKQMKKVQEKLGTYQEPPKAEKVDTTIKKVVTAKSPAQEARWAEAERRLKEYRAMSEIELKGGDDNGGPVLPDA